MHTGNATLLPFSGWTKATVRRKRHVVCSVEIVWGGDLLQAGLHAPDLLGILGNGAIAGEFAASGNVADHLLGPLFRILLNRTRREIRTMRIEQESEARIREKSFSK